MKPSPKPLPARLRIGLKIALLVCGLSGLAGCDAPYEKKDGTWHYDNRPVSASQADAFTPLKGPFARSPEGGFYRGSRVEGSDGASFEALDDHHARDKARVYFCDTYRKGQDYYTIAYNRIDVVQAADAASFRVIQHRYARDARRLFYSGKAVPVKDLESFEVLAHDFARDKLVGYHRRQPVAGSDGASFTVLSPSYARDKAHVFYVFSERSEPNAPDVPRSQRMTGADPATFEVLTEPDGDADARDAKGRFKRGQRLAP